MADPALEEFQFKLYTLLEKGDGSLIRWHRQGFEVPDRSRFVQEVTAPLFGFSEWESFLEVLVDYGFRTKQRCPSSEGSENGGVFAHPFFRRGDRLALAKIHSMASGDVGGAPAASWQGKVKTKSTRQKRKANPEAGGKAATKSRKKRARMSLVACAPQPSCVACGRETGLKATCNACGGEYHPRCLDPPMKKVADGAWMCSLCSPSERLHATRADAIRPPVLSLAARNRRTRSATLVSSVLARLPIDSRVDQPLASCSSMTLAVELSGKMHATAERRVSYVTDALLVWAFGRTTAERPAELSSANKHGRGSFRVQGTTGDNPCATSCRVCEGDGTHATCAECRSSFHLDCMKPPLARVPGEGWMCSFCLLDGCSTPGGGANDSDAIMDGSLSNGSASDCDSEMFNKDKRVGRGEQVHLQRNLRSSGEGCMGCSDQGENVAACTSCSAPYHHSCMDPACKDRPPNDWQCEVCLMAEPAGPDRLSSFPQSTKRTAGRLSAISTYTCSVCDVCKEQEVVGNCTSCNAGFHPRCMDPPRRTRPIKGYKCVSCRLKGRRSKNTRPSCTGCLAIDRRKTAPCVSCDSRFHPACMHPPCRSSKTLPRMGYTCPACRPTCTICKVAEQQWDEIRKAAMVMCAKCELTFHRSCLDPLVERIPEEWSCVNCTASSPASPDSEKAAEDGAIDAGEPADMEASTSEEASFGGELSTCARVGAPQAAATAREPRVHKRVKAPKVASSTNVEAMRCSLCTVCGDAGGSKMSVCGSCGDGYHFRCLPRPRTRVASQTWKCDDCRAVNSTARNLAEVVPARAPALATATTPIQASTSLPVQPSSVRRNLAYRTRA